MTKLANRLATFAVSVGFATSGGAARAAVPEEETPTVAGAASSDFPTRPWMARAEGWILETRTGSIGPDVEVGVTAGRFVAARLALEGTLMDGPYGAWSAMANARWAPLRTENGRHALTLAGGPLVVVNNGVHGTTPLAHAELAYLYQAPFGLTVLAGMGLNMALVDSGYVPPDSCSLGCPGEIHRGDLLRQARLAIGWTF
jgi:hypothetical protein